MRRGIVKKTTAVFGVCIFFFSLMNQAYADNAEVLPKGVFRANFTGNFYFPIDKRFDPDGDTEDVATDYNDTLNSNIFPEFAMVEEAFGMPPGSANIGDTIVSFEYKLDDYIFNLYYGLTDKLTVGVKVPFYRNKTDVSTARLNTKNATAGKNEELNTIAPLDVPGTVPFDTEDIQNLLGRGVDINNDGSIDIPGYGYKRFETCESTQIADIELGFRYQYFKTDKWRLAFTGGVRFPTGQVDDPDNLVDLSFGSGAYALLFRLNNDYTGIKNTVLNFTVKYDVVLSDNETKRVPNSVDQPITRNKENVERNLGDIVELEASGDYEFHKGLSGSLLYRYGFKQKDSVSGDKGFSYSSLEDETDWTYHAFIIGISYSTLPLFIEKKFPVPLKASLSYENDFAGSNNFLKQQLITFELTAFF
jgi:hypothetical protein